MELKDNYTIARSLKRKFILNLGPTNSGKTYQAFEKLKNYSSGCYLAPLRLLAQEGQIEIKKRGLPCSLQTGEEIIVEENAQFTSSTIEMANYDAPMNIAVIDEVQLLKDPQRGFAWINAVLGIPAEYVVCCGSTEIKDLLKVLINYCGDEIIEENEYTRKVPLTFTNKPVSFKKVEKGDAIIAFSRKDVLSYRDFFIDKGRTVSVIYGNLSPEVRRQQSELFSNGTNDIVIATDAIGMGLNLPIRRVIFSTIVKYDGIEERELTYSEIKQISGRAGRYGIYDEGFVGFVNGFTKDSVKYLDKAVKSPLKQYEENFYYAPLKEVIFKLLKDYSWEKSLRKWQKESIAYLDNIIIPVEVSDEWYKIAKALDEYEIKDRELGWKLLHSPASIKDDNIFIVENAIKSISEQEKVPLPKLKAVNLETAEKLYRQMVLYVWCGLRLSSHFPHLEEGREKIKELNEMIYEYLKNTKFKHHVCEKCGCQLPLSFKHKKCDNCFNEGRMRFDYDLEDEDE
jgi:ATP-dependent RNA helicase SUPV3L1/SUV3